MSKSLRADRFRLGVCYYPEHWPGTLWADDFRRMKEMGLSVVRMAEFAWSIFEPEEGRFEFGFFDRVMDLAHEHGLEVILGTPTATPPAWLSHQYPEILNATREGVVYRHGQRRHYNYNAPIYRDLCARIAGRMAEHYAGHPALIGWQIDNELNCETADYYSEADDGAFRQWLRNRYGSLDALNEAWGAVFWNQTYSDWAQVHLSGPTPSDSPNPHHLLDEKRFFSDSTIAFARVQVNAIRAHDKTHFITTNGTFGHLDNHRMTDELLDFFSHDSYPNFAQIWPDEGDDPLLDRMSSGVLSHVRDISPNFCVMEQQSGPGGWVNRLEQPTPKPGQIRLWTYQSIAHGADMVLFFRWRTAPFGTEIYWYGINDHSNVPNRRCDEVVRIGREARKLDPLVGARNVADVAIVRDYPNLWDGEFDRWHGPLSQLSDKAWYRALQRMHVQSDILFLRPATTAEELAHYRVLIYPHPATLSNESAEILKAFVHEGGTVVFGCRTGYKDQRGHCPMRPCPGPVADLCGVTVTDFTRIGPLQIAPSVWIPGHDSFSSGPFNEVLEAGTAEVLATYGDDAGHYAGKPALTRNGWGAGNAYYFGGVFSDVSAKVVGEMLGVRSPLAEEISLPPEVELVIRQSGRGDRFAFLLNYEAVEHTVVFHNPVVDLLHGLELCGKHRLPPFGVSVVKLG